MAFAPRNHPQQVATRGAVAHVDDRWTPLNLWIPWNERWRFTLDAAASADNHLCDRYYTIEDDGLAQPWEGERVWINPPFSAMPAWVAKARAEAPRCPAIVMLAPANRTEQRWWQEHVEPFRDRGRGLSTVFLPRRINFASRSNPGGWFRSSAPFGCVLLVWESHDDPGRLEHRGKAAGVNGLTAPGSGDEA